MIQAKIIADSLAPTGERLTTLEVIMPRYILAEFNTHRMLSKNSASSRAIPVKKMIKSIQDNLFTPYAWQKEHTGMQGTEYITDKDVISALIMNHKSASNEAIARVEMETKLGSTKQIANRKLEPFMYHKVLVSGTEWENFFNLRCPQYEIITQFTGTHIFKSWKEMCESHHEVDEDVTPLAKLQYNRGQADIHMMFLAEAIYDAMNESVPNKLKAGEWHIPYGDLIAITKAEDTEGNDIPDFKRRISVARCARLSYQTLGDNSVIDYEKDLELYEVLSKSGHWSPFEHVAKVMTENEYSIWTKGKLIEVEGLNSMKEVVNNGQTEGWCRNFRGFIQYRELLDN